jgi:threonylcarbamoyladenosine tRNA methylthiotransferase MtaB
VSELYFITFGCRLNAYESEAMRARLETAGIGEAVVVNTCAVTAEAVRQSRQAIRRARREHPQARIVVTGCAAQVQPNLYATMPEVDLVLGNGEKMHVEEYFAPREDGGRVKVGDIMAERTIRDGAVESFEGRTRAYLQIQNGCDHRCTFCIIPFGRGPSRSVGLNEAIEAGRRLVEGGCREIVLTGVDLTSYGVDLADEPTLGHLVRTLLKHLPELPRLRLSSIDSIEADRDLMQAIAEEERLMPYFHLSAQSGDDMILKRMKRRHHRADTIRFCDEVRRVRPDAAFGADLIAGFPTENEDMFANTLQLVDDAGLTVLHVFPFSPRQGTPAAKMPQLPREIVKNRARRLRAKGEDALAIRLAKLIGTEQDVLIEKPGVGRTRCFVPAFFDGDTAASEIRRVRITGTGHDHLKAELTS